MHLKVRFDYCDFEDLPLNAEVLPVTDGDGKKLVIVRDVSNGVEYILPVPDSGKIQRCWLAETNERGVV